MKRIALVLAGFILLIGVLFTVKLFQFYTKIHTNFPSIAKSKPPEEKSVYNILLLGYGGGNHDGTYLTDTMMLVHVDIKAKKLGMISIPRDIWVKLPTKSGQDFHEKINSVYQMGLYPDNYPDIKVSGEGDQAAADLVKGAVSQITGLPVDNYLAIDFDGFKKAVDLLGGVDVSVIKTFDDYEYPVDGKEKDLCGKKPEDLPELEKIATQDAVLAFPCRYEHLHFDAGMTHMDGETALKYVRSRHSLQDGSDFGRAARQQRFLEAMRDKVLSVGFIPKIIPLLDQMSDYIKTDLPLDTIQKLGGVATQSKQYKSVSIIPSYDNFLKSSTSDYGGYILVPDAGDDNWSEVKAWIKTSIEIGTSDTPTPTQPPVTPSPKITSSK